MAVWLTEISLVFILYCLPFYIGAMTIYWKENSTDGALSADVETAALKILKTLRPSELDLMSWWVR